MRQPQSTRRGFLLGALAAALAMVGWPFLERFQLKLERVDVPIASLPEGLDGLTIGLITDVHVGHFAGAELAERVAALVHRVRPDLILFGGDLIHDDTPPAQVAAMARAFGTLSAPLGRYAVLGNHDYAAGEQRLIAALHDAGIPVLVNEGRRIEAGQEAIWLAGVDDFGVSFPDLRQAMRGARDERLRLLLVHEPDYADSADVAQYGQSIQLQLSGHSHGGQVRLPGIGPVHLPPYARRYPMGLQRAEGSDMWVYTSRGIGVSGPPIRLFCPPEVTLLRLRRAGA